MSQSSQVPVSREVVRAVLTTRDHRHNETHAIMLAMFQGLVTELVQQGVLNPAMLAQRLSLTEGSIRTDAHGDPARDMLAHVLNWLQSVDGNAPPPHPDRWFAPGEPSLG